MNKRSAVIASLLALGACGGEGTTGGTVKVATSLGDFLVSVTPSPTPSASGDATELAVTVTPDTSLEPIAPYTYPATATVSIGDVTYPMGATSVDVPISLDHATPNTVYVRVKTVNGSGSVYAYSGAYFKAVDTYVVFRPGDPLTQTVSIPILKTKAGALFKLSMPEAPQGATQGKSSGVLTPIAGAPATQPITAGFRKPRVFAATGTLSYEMNPATVAWSDKGGPGVFSTSLSHGRTQPGNGETGLYLDAALHPTAEAPASVSGGKLVIHSQKLATPISYGGAAYSYGASMLSGRNSPEMQVTYGQYEWVATMPDRRGSWPALWLVGVKGWPPEIDVYEGFGQNASFDFARDITANIHGGPIGTRKFTRSMWIDATQALGIANVARTAHRYAVDIQPDYITWFIDGIESYQARNPFSEAFYPLMNVAVKTTGDYTGGVADMEVHSFKVWRNK